MPALAVVQILKLRADQENNISTGLKARQDANLQCQELVETCQVFASSGDGMHGCDKVLEYGQICLYPLTVAAS